MKTTVERQINSFLSAVLDREDPDYVVTVERKGTALLRTLHDGNRALYQKMAPRVIASDALPLLSRRQLKGKRILLLDDAICQGRRITLAKDYLCEAKHVDPSQVKVAAFSVHKRARPGLADYCWFGQLEDDSFRRTRTEMLQAFQMGGSLLLATERLEIVVSLRCSRVELFDALCQAGDGVELFSVAGRTHLTVHDPLLVDEGELLDLLPPGTEVAGAIRKIRVIERRDGRFSICPIFYPSSPLVGPGESITRMPEALRVFVGNLDDAKPDVLSKALFQSTALLSSMFLLRTVAVALRSLENADKIDLSVPKHTEDSVAGIGRLRMIFPKIDLDAVAGFVESALGYRKAWPRKHDARRSRRLDAGVGTEGHGYITDLQWQLARGIFRITEHDPARQQGATWIEVIDSVFRQRSLLTQDKLPYLSAALDNAIDQADVVTDLGIRCGSDGIRRHVRVFRTDGELVTADLRRMDAVWKSDQAPPQE